MVCLGPPAADDALRRAIATGAARAVRIDGSTALDSRHVATELAGVVGGSDLVVCGDFSLDRGTGSVPAFLAHELGAAQALGLLARRRTRRVTRPCAASVASTAAAARCSTSDRRPSSRWKVRSPGCDGRRSARSSAPRRRRSRSSRRLPTSTPPPPSSSPYRPRARVLPPPHGDVLDRVRGILDVGGAHTSHGDAVVLEPAAAAAPHRRSARGVGVSARAGRHRYDDRGWHGGLTCDWATRPGARSPTRRDRNARVDGVKSPIVLIPVGSTEQHGPHLPARHRHADRRGARRPGDPPDRRLDGRPDDLGQRVGRACRVRRHAVDRRSR